MEDSLLIMVDQPSFLNRSTLSHNCTSPTGPSNKIFIRILFTFRSCFVMLVLFINCTVQFDFFLVARLNINLCLELWVAYCNTYTWFFFIIRTWKWAEETRPKRRLKKLWICEISFTNPRSFHYVLSIIL